MMVINLSEYGLLCCNHHQHNTATLTLFISTEAFNRKIALQREVAGWCIHALWMGKRYCGSLLWYAEGFPDFVYIIQLLPCKELHFPEF